VHLTLNPTPIVFSIHDNIVTQAQISRIYKAERELFGIVYVFNTGIGSLKYALENTTITLWVLKSRSFAQNKARNRTGPNMSGLLNG